VLCREGLPLDEEFLRELYEAGESAGEAEAVEAEAEGW
jgi:hypothetical protein